MVRTIFQNRQICLTLPKPAIRNFDISVGRPSAQIAEIVETFDWEQLPSDVDLNFRQDRLISVCFSVSLDADKRLRAYCDRESKHLNNAVVQALVILSKYKMPSSPMRKKND